MELQHINVKLYLQHPEKVKQESLVPVFHEWIQNQVCEELLIDVADYRHVHAGPGVVLIGHQADYSLDNTGNRMGIRYNRKAALAGSNRDRFAQALRSALQACQRLESDARLASTFRFNRQDLKLFVNDRMLAPKFGRDAVSVETEFRDFFGDVVGTGEFEMKVEADSRSLFGAEIKTAQPFDVEGVLARLG
ncbi:MAG: hypothetical protein L0387_44700 [Acidobacteria bacterium]|nr:hypothetical protein [Acidobacteriota bacterium]MCI0628679.1 hypothetical protein [Acidobacteriota bacterium]MCI0720764.1 hypothetical protein [Acidobacteriota bacterium]